MRAFLETSALVKRYTKEPGSGALDEMVALVIATKGDLLISNVVALEVVGCFAKKYRSGSVATVEEYARLVERFEFDYEDLFGIVRLIDDRCVSAFRLAVAEPNAGIDAADRLHVAAALDAKYAAPAMQTAFVTSDRSLYGYAGSKGLRPWNPERDGLEQFVRIWSGPASGD